MKISKRDMAKIERELNREPRVVPELTRTLLELRSSGAAGTHGDRRTKRLRDRGSNKRAAIREQT